MKIGVFDSGVGGESFIEPLQNRFPEAEIVYKTDTVNIPYGNKSPEQLIALATPILLEMQSSGCQVIVIACNTLSSNCIDELREAIEVPLIAVEPMLELAVELSVSGVVAVCATPSTLASSRYNKHKNKLGSIQFIEPDCSQWASMIEQNKSNEIQIEHTIEEVLTHLADVIVLGCTHYHWIEQEIRSAANGKAVVIQPTDRILIQVERTLRDSLRH